MDVKAIFVIVERGKADFIVQKAKKAGADGATIMYGRGTGHKEFKKFFDLHIESSKEIILILTEEEKLKSIVDAIIKAGRLDKPGAGIIFTIDIDNLFGLYHIKENKKIFDF
ncbi:MAG: P-II family nitrogen regulator [Clostridia bacterium]|nr:P-II family nitrogen regulator [Clostridia bacterium]